MKRILALCFLLNAYLNTAAQSNFYKLSAGAGAGITQSFTEVQKHDFGLAGYGTLDYGLDGYDDTKITFKSEKPDIYTFLSIGVKYNFGTMGLSRKTFRR